MGAGPFVVLIRLFDNTGRGEQLPLNAVQYGMTKRATSYRLSEDAMRLIATLAEQLGVSQTAVIEIAVRMMAKREGVR